MLNGVIVLATINYMSASPTSQSIAFGPVLLAIGDTVDVCVRGAGFITVAAIDVSATIGLE